MSLHTDGSEKKLKMTGDLRQRSKVYRSFDQGDYDGRLIHNKSAEMRSFDRGYAPDEMIRSYLQRSLDSHGNPKLILYNYRWVVLVCFSLALIAVGMLYATCGTVASLLVTVYDLSIFESNFANLVYFIMYVPGNFLAIAVFNKWGLKVCIVTGALFSLTGAWIRLFMVYNKRISFFYVGSIIAGLGQPFLMNLPSKIASTWFGDKERAIATAVGSMSTCVGALLTFVLPITVISESDFTNKDTGHIDFCYYIMIQTLMITILTLPALSFMREGPPTPPSVVANEFEEMNFGQGMKELISNRNYVLLFLVYVIVYGVIASQSAVLSNLATLNGLSL